MNAMNPVLSQAASRADTQSSSNGALPSSQGLNNMFLQLLVAQLQHQSPLNPMDPTQFVGQLAQFSELSEVTQIEQMLQQAMSTIKPHAAAGVSSPSSDSTMMQHGAQTNKSAATIPPPMLSSAVAAAQSAVPVSSAPVSILNSKIQGVF